MTERLLALASQLPDDALRRQADVDSVVRVPAGLTEKGALLDALAKALAAPAWFGHNWDALSELLRDLSWRPEDRLLLHHQDWPLSGAERQTYLDILREAVAPWSTERPARLCVSFPPASSEGDAAMATGGLPESIRRSYVIDDFELWDAAIHGAVVEFHTCFGCYPAELRAHPSAIERFLARARPSNLESLAELEDDTPLRSGTIGAFASEDYELAVVEDSHVWPATFVLVRSAQGQPVPDADTPPELRLASVATTFDTPAASRPLEAPVRFLSAQCARCRWLTTPATCAAFPAGIPLSIAQSRADHTQPFDGDGDLRFERSLDPSAPSDALIAHMMHPERRLRRSDGPIEPPET